MTEQYVASVDPHDEPVGIERTVAVKTETLAVSGRVDRIDMRGAEAVVVDYKTGRHKTDKQLREDIQLSLYQMGAREAWGLPGSAQSYYYVLENEKVPVEHTEDELQRVRTAVTEIADGILAQDFDPTPSPDICAVCDYRIICPAAEK